VRRLLENGANSSFVSVAADPSVPITDILRRPHSAIAGAHAARSSKIPLPRDIYLPERRPRQVSSSASARRSTLCWKRFVPAHARRRSRRPSSTVSSFPASNVL